jgi:hypothetical protein
MISARSEAIEWLSPPEAISVASARRATARVRMIGLVEAWASLYAAARRALRSPGAMPPVARAWITVRTSPHARTAGASSVPTLLVASLAEHAPPSREAHTAKAMAEFLTQEVSAPRNPG